MNLQERIARRRSAHQGRTVVVDRDHLSPVVHRPEPIGRGPVLEQLLDELEPVFDGKLPEPVAVVGPPGSGTSAIVTALFDALNDRLGESSRSIATTTRAGSTGPVTWFVYVDGRRVESAFAFYQAVLSVISAEPVPESGIGTDDLRERLTARLARHDRRAVVAIDHHDEPETLRYERARELLEPVSDSVATIAVGQSTPEKWAPAHVEADGDVDGDADRDEDGTGTGTGTGTEAVESRTATGDDSTQPAGSVVTVPAYRHHELVDVITDRASTGLAAGVLDHESVRELAIWADGNAHDALAALFGAACCATATDATRIDASHLEAARGAVPADGVHVDRALALSETRQQVLGHLVDVDTDDRPIREVASAIAERSTLTNGTVKRFLYELADRGVIERVPLPTSGSGRRPSTVEPRFPTLVFGALTSATAETATSMGGAGDGDTDLNAVPDTDMDTETNTDTETDTDIDTNTEPDTDTSSNTDTNTDIDTNTEPDADTNTNTSTNEPP
ncbi:cell division control protein 6 [Natrialba hulunbeirensis JCM 10989]|uniref:Cell division control protein 6 n=1 Tax=Natrialba hulunbeirensis JCM 10989 TaxID=1227493 RepID=M0A3Z7_9EURY|nr:AAA family ATPase [Natrialba hulunbeirensis]ELY93319.1 cell division control protein 6 [Natrialba hulunbeirensis JCM 10989]